MPNYEAIRRIHQPALFITTAHNKQEVARKAGYDTLPLHLLFIAEEAGRREDLFAQMHQIKTVDHHYGLSTTIPNTVHVAANKAEGVDWCYEQLRQQNPGRAMELAGRAYEVMDNQMVIVDPHGKKIALKKPRTDTLMHNLVDIEKLINALKVGSMNGSHIEYLSAFVKGEFGHPAIKEYRTVRSIVGTLLPQLDYQLMQQLMMRNAHITGGIDIEELAQFFIDNSGAQVTTRVYREGGRHYKDGMVFVDRLIPEGEHSVDLGDPLVNDPRVLANIARGFCHAFAPASSIV